jgi:hypothetical protein
LTGRYDIPFTMTGTTKRPPSATAKTERRPRRKVPQHVSVRGGRETVTVSTKGNLTGAALVAAMQEAPYRRLDLIPKRGPMPVRGVDLT